MNLLSLRSSSLLLAAVTLSVSGCVTRVVERPAPVVHTEYIPAPPPETIVEERPAPPGPPELFFWKAGFYRWDHGRYVWEHGRWERRPGATAEWVEPRWEHHPEGWIFIEGHFR